MTRKSRRLFKVRQAMAARNQQSPAGKYVAQVTGGPTPPGRKETPSPSAALLSGEGGTLGSHCPASRSDLMDMSAKERSVTAVPGPCNQQGNLPPRDCFPEGYRQFLCLQYKLRPPFVPQSESFLSYFFWCTLLLVNILFFCFSENVFILLSFLNNIFTAYRIIDFFS